ncbi:LEAF RUST 10 DISEASE-RESISTANCE LOCUS RECEPTOR-LIKE PROTEIN KINASE-like 2.5 [Neltuma alba]|uniref:LEAF RUST 10 DISEASE-RESISTANCE LOCUS RECEPTOR-LIKE PROTEIN KINASE-like 2.5 n=1 Tax=Neltuma alba TaxID=207710 RepID=UPI0010A584A7|nr:LEAF RUST 10 DISEASE-RESISTANCE LOCUS RECEPTOR-LIKE PROTEIN KINASE-like 2.5 [Prosopis alba]
MDREKGLRCWHPLLVTLLLLYGLTNLPYGLSKSREHPQFCVPSRCGNITNIGRPFRLPDDPPNCGDRIYELVCDDNVTYLSLPDGKYRVLGINYDNYTIRLLDEGIQEGTTSSLPLYPLSISNFHSFVSPHGSYEDSSNPYSAKTLNSNRTESIIIKKVGYLNCSDAVRDDAAYVDTALCVNWQGGHLYAVAGDLLAPQFKPQCRLISVTFIASDWESLVPGRNKSCANIHKVLSYGFELSWLPRACADLRCPNGTTCYFSPEIKRLQCLPRPNNRECITPFGISSNCRVSKLRIVAEDFINGIATGLKEMVGKTLTGNYHSDYITSQSTVARKLGMVIGTAVLPTTTVRFLWGIMFLSVLCIYKCRRRPLSMYENIEDFIRLQNLNPLRYSYKDLETMTSGFKNKLGEGGFGTVYKGKLRSGYDVAVKMLGKSKANGQEFISEVATIGRIHHANVVRLVGFCVQRTKRALVYEFMPNGSLDKYIFSKEEGISLTLQKLHEISLGIAHGIAYLHHGCDVQILHFDIKPHNILLDDDFNPKISDFGLARLYSSDDSVATLTAARGTIGYMAPELFYKNIGRVSYKSDIYSFGMLLMEMASQRRNLNPHVEYSSQLYFPLWIYDQFDEEKDIEMKDLTEEEKNLAKKMFIVALWCIQLNPTDRPSMNKVIKMLEADDAKSLEMPPKPSLYPNEEVLVNDETSSSLAASAISRHSNSSQDEGASDGK